jgi:hypothetical protein
MFLHVHTTGGTALQTIHESALNPNRPQPPLGFGFAHFGPHFALHCVAGYSRQETTMHTLNCRHARIVLAIGGLVAAITPLGAIPRPPFELRDKAPEQLVIEVVAVKVDHDTTALEVEAQVKIVNVAKSEGRLMAGQLISIRYTTYQQSPSVGTCATPQMPVLIKNRQYKAFLTKASREAFAPAAGWLSFEGS